jgi:hypothetical protein
MGVCIAQASLTMGGNEDVEESATARQSEWRESARALRQAQDAESRDKLLLIEDAVHRKVVDSSKVSVDKLTRQSL